LEEKIQGLLLVKEIVRAKIEKIRNLARE